MKMPAHTQWNPLSVAEVMRLFAHAPFAWGLAGGYAIEQFVGKPIRSHGDIDVVIFRDNQLLLQTWLQEWSLYAADPPGELREWGNGEYLPPGISRRMMPIFKHACPKCQPVPNSGSLIIFGSLIQTVTRGRT